jgi:N-acetylmuramoyl-L-alanine amidase
MTVGMFMSTVTTETPLALASVDPLPPPRSTSSDSYGTRALVTGSGVIVAVRSKSAYGYVITTPCGNTGVARKGLEIEKTAVVLDPGHGGPIDTGAVGANGLPEKDVNLRVALTTQRILTDRGISSILTRTADYASPLSVRAALADAVEAAVLVSIHHNAPTPQRSTLPGTEVFVQSNRAESRRLGGLLQKHVVESLSLFSRTEWHAAADAGVLTVLSTQGRDAYGMIRLPTTVAALAELAYISAPSEARLLASDFYSDIAGRALADAIEDYLRTDDLGGGYVDTPRVFNPLPGVGAGVCQEVALG